MSALSLCWRHSEWDLEHAISLWIRPFRFVHLTFCLIPGCLLYQSPFWSSIPLRQSLSSDRSPALLPKYQRSHTHTLAWLIKSLSGHLRSGCYRGNSCQLEKQLICKQAGQQQAWAFQSRAGPLRRADKTAAGYLLYILIKCLLTTVILTVIKLLL